MSLLKLIQKIFSKKSNIYEALAYHMPPTASNWNDIEEYIRNEGLCIYPLLDFEATIALETESKIFADTLSVSIHIDEFLAVGRVSSAEMRKKSTALIHKFLYPKLQALIPQSYEIITGIHLLKPKGDKGILHPHQDSSLIDEQQYNSYLLWMPVTDINEEDGMICAIPNSHKLEIPYRTLNIPWALSDYEKLLWQFVKKIEVPRGHVLLFHPALIHSSGLNNGNQLRIAINSFLKPKAAPLIHYYADPSDNYKTIYAHQVHSDFYYEEDIMEKPSPKFPLLFTAPNTNKSYTFDELTEIFTAK